MSIHLFITNIKAISHAFTFTTIVFVKDIKLNFRERAREREGVGNEKYNSNDIFIIKTNCSNCCEIAICQADIADSL